LGSETRGSFQNFWQPQSFLKHFPDPNDILILLLKKKVYTRQKNILREIFEKKKYFTRKKNIYMKKKPKKKIV
jgi:hypothetical protein